MLALGYTRTHIRRLYVLGAATNALWFSGSRAAAEPVEPVRLEYRALADGCPDATAFLDKVRTHTAGIRLAAPGEAARTFRVNISAAEQGKLRGEFLVSAREGPEDTSASRVISGDTCGEIVEALAVFAALSLGSEAPPPRPLPEQPKEPPPETPAPPVQPIAEKPAPRPRVRATPAPAETPFAPAHWCGRAGLGLRAVGVGTPSRLLMPGLFGELGYERSASEVHLEPLLRLGFSRAGVDTEATPQGAAHLRWTTVRLDACALSLRPDRDVAVRPCLSATAGLFNVTGRAVAQPRSRELAWWAAGGLLRAQWRAWSHLTLEAELAIEAPLRRDRFHVEPATAVYRVPATLGSAGIALSIDFL